MIAFALNHMTVRRFDFARLVAAAADLGCVGIEVRNDLGGPLFDGLAPERAGALVRERGLRLLSVAELKCFNDWTADRARAAAALIDIASRAGAEAVSLIPRNDGQGTGNGERQANLRLALRNLAPMLADRGLVGLIEPLGFGRSSLRLKREAVDAIEGLGVGDRFRLVHDSFHHALAGETQLFPAETGLVHVSGVADGAVDIDAMEDAHRGLVGPVDRLDNLGQLQALLAAGYGGPVSMESFAPEVHRLADPVSALARSFEFLRSTLAGMAVSGAGATMPERASG